jgi:hypothetical protein
MRKIIGFSLSSMVLAMPALASAVGILDTLVTVNRILNGVIGIIITLAIIFFFWGLVTYLMGNAGEAKAKGLVSMMWGLLMIFVMVSIWGLIHLLQYTFGVQGANQAIIPDVIPSGYLNNR